MSNGKFATHLASCGLSQTGGSCLELTCALVPVKCPSGTQGSWKQGLNGRHTQHTEKAHLVHKLWGYAIWLGSSQEGRGPCTELHQLSCLGRQLVLLSL